MPNVPPTDPQGAGETREVIVIDEKPMTDAEQDAFWRLLTTTTITRIAVREEGV